MKKLSLLSLCLMILICISPGAHAEIFKLRKSAQECDDLYPEMGEWFQATEAHPTAPHAVAPINRILGPVVNQDREAGWCFAFTAADMLTEAIGQRISGAHVAKTYFDQSWHVRIFGNKTSGDTASALEINLGHGLCEERGFSSKIITNLTLAKDKKCTAPLGKFHNYKVTKHKSTGHYDGFILFDDIDESLEEGRIVGVEYDEDQLINDRKFNGYEKVVANHASTIVARYFDKRESSCRYVIRNSFGKTCKKINSKKTKCVDGYYSVQEEQLTRMLVNAITMKSERH